AFELFAGLLDRIRMEVVRVLMTVRIQSPGQVEDTEPETSQLENVQYHHSDYDAALSGEDPGLDEQGQAANSRQGEQGVPRVGRNQPCPCGSCKKYKHCHGRVA